MSPRGPEPELPKRTKFDILDNVWKKSEQGHKIKFTDETKKEDVLPVYVPGFGGYPEKKPNALMKRILDADYSVAGAEALDLVKLYDQNNVMWGCQGGTYYIVLKTGLDLNFFAQSSSMAPITLRSSFEAKHNGM